MLSRGPLLSNFSNSSTGNNYDSNCRVYESTPAARKTICHVVWRSRPAGSERGYNGSAAAQVFIK